MWRFLPHDDSGDRALEAAARGAERLIEMYQSLLEARTETFHSDIAGDLMNSAAGPFVRFGAG